MPLISDAEKASLIADLDNVAQVWNRSITGYKPVNISAQSSTDSFNYIYQNTTPESSITTTTVSGVFDARVWYLPADSNYIKNIPIDDAQLKASKGIIRLKLNEAGYAFISDSKYVKFDDRTCQVVSDIRRHGLFGADYITLYLMMVD